MLKFYNTLTNQKDEFTPVETGKIKMYNCGPTVYDYAHIGNLNAYLFADTLRRFLEYKGYEVRQIMNITDVGHLSADDVNQADSGEDKMLKAAKREKKTPMDIANFYADTFFEDLENLNIKKAAYYPRATAHVPQMIKMVQTLIEKGLAYEANGNVFYDVEKFENYGKLSNKKLDELKHGARLEDHPDKKHPYDFALWLKAPKEHLMKWESPWSVGYPGWHIECSAMSMQYLGQTMDIHTGGEDHIFPHHENEIAQSEGATGQSFSNYWMHVHFLLVDGQKMSKSKGNFFTLKNVLDKGYSPMAFRLLVLSSHYRSNLNFTWQSMDQAQKNLEKTQRFVDKLKEIQDKKFDLEDREDLDLSTYRIRFEEAMDDDLNTPQALSVLYELISEINKDLADNRLDSTEAKNTLTLWEKMNQVFGLRLEKKISLLLSKNINLSDSAAVNTDIPKEILELANERLKARLNEDFKKSDELRDKISELGYLAEDTAEGQKIRKK